MDQQVLASGGMGQPVRRKEDFRLLTGGGRYTDDVTPAGTLRAVFVRSPHAHARITAVDTGAARAMPGVRAVLTVADLDAAGIPQLATNFVPKNRDGTDMATPTRPVLARDRVRHVGDAIAMVVAETLAQARDAAEAVAVDYDILPAVTDAVAATAPAAPRLFDGTENQVLDWWRGSDPAALDAAFAAAHHVTRLRLVNNRVVVASMEPRGGLAEWDGTRLTFTTSTQGSHKVRDNLAKYLRLDPASVRVITPDVGGGFGMKIFFYPEYVCVAQASRMLGAPVKWTSERTEAFLSDTHGRDYVVDGELALDAEGRFTALRVTNHANLGAYLSDNAAYPPSAGGTRMLCGVYATPLAGVNVRGVLTNSVPVAAYRGAGRPEYIFIVERLVDVAAAETGIPAAALRAKNFIRAEQMPHKLPNGVTYDSGDFPGLFQAALARADVAGFEARRAESARRGCYRGLGVVYYIEACGGGPDETARIRFDRNGGVRVLHGTQSNGQGHETAYAQIIATRLGLDFDSVILCQGDTDEVPTGRGTGGSRSLPVGGSALQVAADAVIEKAKRLASIMLEAAEADLEFAAGAFRISGTDRTVTLREVITASFRRDLWPEDLDPLLDSDGTYTALDATFPNGTHAVELEIDAETAAVTILRYTALDDFGGVINPLMLESQVHGGIVQGIGQALTEHTVHDDAGQLLTASFMDYALPRAEDVTQVDFSTRNIPCRNNILGLKGAGEAGAVAAPPAIVAAVCDALRDFGVRHIDMPITREKIFRILGQARKAAAE